MLACSHRCQAADHHDPREPGLHGWQQGSACLRVGCTGASSSSRPHRRWGTAAAERRKLPCQSSRGSFADRHSRRRTQLTGCWPDHSPPVAMLAQRYQQMADAFTATGLSSAFIQGQTCGAPLQPAAPAEAAPDPGAWAASTTSSALAPGQCPARMPDQRRGCSSSRPGTRPGCARSCTCWPPALRATCCRQARAATLVPAAQRRWAHCGRPRRNGDLRQRRRAAPLDPVLHLTLHGAVSPAAAARLRRGPANAPRPGGRAGRSRCSGREGARL